MKYALQEILQAANQGGYAIPAINYTSIYDLLATASAAEEMKAPVIIQAGPAVVHSFSAEICGAIGLQMDRLFSVPVINHLDHAKNVESCKKAIDMGFPSVMIDASKYPLKKNIQMVKEVVNYAHAKNVCVEAEIGKIKGRGYDEGNNDGAEDFLVDVDEAVALVQATNVDSLAIGLGNGHGFYTENPKLHFERLAEVKAALPIPLVLHGGTGLPDADVRKAIKMGINKVNVGTGIRSIYLHSFHDHIEKHDREAHTTLIMKEVQEDVKQEVKRIIALCMAEGKG